MTDDDHAGPRPPPSARQDRLRDALRENLKRRKSQLRGRAGQAAEPADVTPSSAALTTRGEPDRE